MMKKGLAALLTVLLCLSLTACGRDNGKPEFISTEHSLQEAPETVTMLPVGEWPENEYTQGVPRALGQRYYVTEDKAHNSCGILVVNVDKDQLEWYEKKLKEEGFQEMKKMAEAIEVKAPISIGTLYSNGIKTVSLAYSSNAMMITILPTGIQGGNRGSAMTNVRVYAYATYDEQDGVQSVTEMYVSEKEDTKPQFTALNGRVLMVFPEEEKDFYFGAREDGTEAIASALSTGVHGTKGQKATMIVSGSAYADNAVAGGGSFVITYEITMP